MSSGRRDIRSDDKQFIAELARCFHVEKAAQKAAKVEKRNSSKKESTSKKKSARKSGGSITITFKGGFAGIPVVDGRSKKAEDRIASIAAFRGKIAESSLIKAVGHANAYMESARDQAAEAGLHYTNESSAHRELANATTPPAEDGAVSYAEGDAYLAQQSLIATKPLEHVLKLPIGSHKASLLGSAGMKEPVEVPPAFATREAKERFEDAVISQKRLVPSAPGEAEVVRAGMYFNITQFGDSQIKDTTAQKGGNTLCLVKSKVSGVGSSSSDAARKAKKKEKAKKATLAFRTKAKADGFVQNFMNNFIRKEMSGSMCVRDGTGAAAESTAGQNTNASSLAQNPAKPSSKKSRR